eukprot:1358453-Amphidinium_carterae.1
MEHLILCRFVSGSGCGKVCIKSSTIMQTVGAAGKKMSSSLKLTCETSRHEQLEFNSHEGGSRKWCMMRKICS